MSATSVGVGRLTELKRWTRKAGHRHQAAALSFVTERRLPVRDAGLDLGQFHAGLPRQCGSP
jgi:hypothetical protein